ncbi:MAG: class I SAM-dependent methyltransferase [Acidimicrobiales bacterium]
MKPPCFRHGTADPQTSGGHLEHGRGYDAFAFVLFAGRRRRVFTRLAALDAPDGSYDVVVTSLMIHHLPEALRPQAMREMFRVLRPGGRVLVADFRPPAGRLGRRSL